MGDIKTSTRESEPPDWAKKESDDCALAVKTIRLLQQTLFASQPQGVQRFASRSCNIGDFVKNGHFSAFFSHDGGERCWADAEGAGRRPRQAAAPHASVHPVAAKAERRLRPQGLQTLWHRQQPARRPGKPQHDCAKGINVSDLFHFLEFLVLRAQFLGL